MHDLLQDAIISVPVGTVVTDDARRVLADLDRRGETYVAARGGAGGSLTTAGELRHGLRGERRHVVLELKSIADVGLVGFPNAGKSSLLAALSRAQPKIADYPFTTVRPNTGMVELPDHAVCRMADIPGLIEGAHRNRGMGHSFLRHIERTRLLLFVVDIHGFQLSPREPHRSASDALRLLRAELALYQPELLAQPSIVVANKMDGPSDAALEAEWVEFVRQVRVELGGAADDVPVLAISAKTGAGLDELRAAIKAQLAAADGGLGGRDGNTSDGGEATFPRSLYSSEAD